MSKFEVIYFKEVDADSFFDAVEKSEIPEKEILSVSRVTDEDVHTKRD